METLILPLTDIAHSTQAFHPQQKDQHIHSCLDNQSLLSDQHSETEAVYMSP